MIGKIGNLNSMTQILSLHCSISYHRPVCGIRGSTIIVNLPGSKKGSQVRFPGIYFLGTEFYTQFWNLKMNFNLSVQWLLEIVVSFLWYLTVIYFWMSGIHFLEILTRRTFHQVLNWFDMLSKSIRSFL